ncbi:MAG: hypothetical protein PF442_08140 [Desulfobulbaceae bacterium]|jgi:hypothetical protein|nr:hypothetical protein [Desulfobulbaceae bacterium]
MEALVEELKKIVTLKPTTDIGDIIIMVIEEPQSLIYGLVTDIERDEHKTDGWWHVSLTLLSMPPQKTTITLRTSQFTGEEIFTMGGDKRFIAAVDLGAQPRLEPVPPAPDGEKKKFGLRVVK